MEHDTDAARLSAIEADLDAIERALARLAEGSYRRCERCGEPIGDARLADSPLVRTCLTHAEG